MSEVISYKVQYFWKCIILFMHPVFIYWKRKIFFQIRNLKYGIKWYVKVRINKMPHSTILENIIYFMLNNINMNKIISIIKIFQLFFTKICLKDAAHFYLSYNLSQLITLEVWLSWVKIRSLCFYTQHIFGFDWFKVISYSLSYRFLQNKNFTWELWLWIFLINPRKYKVARFCPIITERMIIFVRFSTGSSFVTTKMLVVFTKTRAT